VKCKVRAKLLHQVTLVKGLCLLFKKKKIIDVLKL